MAQIRDPKLKAIVAREHAADADHDVHDHELSLPEGVPGEVALQEDVDE